ncbi:putative Glycosyltransferase 2-like domain-containing protein [Seiridium cardinale]|uniref:Glycosyltransferase 2-like domain-containing protein n=1 Tax=Seiridium cardinale TaxID=138064 RepID=A0ABR2XN93_9PEZI
MDARLFLVGAWLIDYADGKIRSHYAAKYRAAEIVQSPKFTPNDVSVVVTVRTPPPNFAACLGRWLENEPLELIVVTTQAHFEQVKTAVASTSLTILQKNKIHIIPIQDGVAKRGKMERGIREAQGKVIALSDDQIYWSDQYLKHCLPCFDEPDVGAAGGPIEVYIPRERRETDIVTPWEAAGAKYLFGGRGGGPAVYAAARWTWCLAGCTSLVRADIIKDERFLEEFTNETFCGTKIEIADDNFISRWLLERNHIIRVQYKPEVRIWRTLKADQSYINQRLRWERSAIISYLKWLCAPQVYQQPIVTWYTFKRLLRVPLTLIYLSVLVHSLFKYPYFTLMVLGYEVFGELKGFKAFWKAYPYMHKPKHVFAAVACDYSSLIFGLWAILTLKKQTWVSWETKIAGEGVVELLADGHVHAAADHKQE